MVVGVCARERRRAFPAPAPEAYQSTPCPPSQSSQGLCQRCGFKGCTAQFHALCAKLHGWFFQRPGTLLGEPPVVLCPGHTPDGIYRYDFVCLR